MPRSQGFNLLVQFAGKNSTRTLDSCKSRCALHWSMNKIILRFCNFFFYFSLHKKSSKRAFVRFILCQKTSHVVLTRGWNSTLTEKNKLNILFIYRKYITTILKVIYLEWNLNNIFKTLFLVHLYYYLIWWMNNFSILSTGTDRKLNNFGILSVPIGCWIMCLHHCSFLITWHPILKIACKSETFILFCC